MGLSGKCIWAFHRTFRWLPSRSTSLRPDVLHLDAVHRRIRREDRRATDVLESSEDRLRTLVIDQQGIPSLTIVLRSLGSNNEINFAVEH